jgi:signal transduction histidine kinase
MARIERKDEEMTYSDTQWDLLNQLTNVKSALDVFINGLAQRYELPVCALYSVNINSDSLELEVTCGVSKDEIDDVVKFNQGWIGKAAVRGKALLGESRSKEGGIGIVVPLEVNETLVGVIYGVGRKRNFSEDEILGIKKQGESFWVWLNRLWYIESLQRREDSLLNLMRTVRELVSQDDLSRVLNLVTRQGAELLKGKLCSLMLLNEDRSELWLRSTSSSEMGTFALQKIKVEEALVGVVVKRGRTLMIQNLSTHYGTPYLEVAESEKVSSLLAVPLSYGGDVLGVLSVYTSESRRFANHEIDLLQGLADASAVAVEKAKLLSRLIEFENQLRQSERLSTLGLLAAEVAHEIRNPLMVMQMLVHGLAESTNNSEIQKRDLEIISEKMRQMNGIVNQVLGLAKNAEPKRELVDVKTMIDRLIHFVRPKFEEARIDMQVSFQKEHIKAMLDQSQIEQVLLNLILNAIQAMPNGGSLRVACKNEEVDARPMLVIDVQDSGLGMSEEMQKKIFNSFLTTKSDGLGLGMAIVRRIVENHYGKIEVRSEKNKGTLVRLFFPA